MKPTPTPTPTRKAPTYETETDTYGNNFETGCSRPKLSENTVISKVDTIPYRNNRFWQMIVSPMSPKNRSNDELKLELVERFLRCDMKASAGSDSFSDGDRDRDIVEKALNFIENESECNKTRINFVDKIFAVLVREIVRRRSVEEKGYVNNVNSVIKKVMNEEGGSIDLLELSLYQSNLSEEGNTLVRKKVLAFLKKKVLALLKKEKAAPTTTTEPTTTTDQPKLVIKATTKSSRPIDETPVVTKSTILKAIIKTVIVSTASLSGGSNGTARNGRISTMETTTPLLESRETTEVAVRATTPLLDSTEYDQPINIYPIAIAIAIAVTAIIAIVWGTIHRKSIFRDLHARDPHVGKDDVEMSRYNRRSESLSERALKDQNRGDCDDASSNEVSCRNSQVEEESMEEDSMEQQSFLANGCAP